MAEGRPLPKFGEWDVNDPTSAEGFTIIFAKASNEKKSGGKDTPPAKDDPKSKHARKAQLRKPHSGHVLEKPGSNKLGESCVVFGVGLGDIGAWAR